MCTVTVVWAAGSGAGGSEKRRGVEEGGDAGAAVFSLAVNRDESRRRSRAEGPRVERFGERRAILPIDPEGGGTWVAVNDAGVGFALLNVNESDTLSRVRGSGVSGPIPSRGGIIPSLLHHGDAASAREALASMDPGRWRPFRLVIVDETGGFEARRAGDGSLAIGAIGLSGAGGGTGRLFCSSGLGDDVADRPRRRLWERMCEGAGPDGWLELQQRFHRHHWADRPELSVCMRRPDARTVSHTRVEVGPAEAAMRHQPGPPDRPEGEAAEVRLPRVGATTGAA